LLLLLVLCACGGPGARTSAPDGATDAGPVADADAGVPPGDEPADAGDVPADGGDVPADGGMPAPSLAGCAMFPPDNDWNRDISAEPVDPHSAEYLAFMGADGLRLQPDFGGPYGQPFLVVPSGQPRAPMSFLYATQSDPGPYPFPPDVPIQDNEDRHVTVLAEGECKLYETYNTFASGSGFHADSGAVFDLTTGALRPDGWTSATASGLPILPGLARYDEAVEQGEMLHALTFTAGATAHKYVAPATHSSGTSDAAFAPPMGLRVRLRADFDLSGFHGASLAVLRALRKHGMFVIDNASGQFWAVHGSRDARWSVEDLDQLKKVPGSAFEVVKLGTVHSGQ